MRRLDSWCVNDGFGGADRRVGLAQGAGVVRAAGVEPRQPQSRTRDDRVETGPIGLLQNFYEGPVRSTGFGRGEPDPATIRAGHHNITGHLDYIAYLADRRRWLAGDAFSLADVAAAAQLSAVDYLGDVPWEDYAEAKDWYARLKSRPSLRPLLADLVPGVPPPKHYADLDF